MGNRASLLKDPNQLIQRYLPNFTYNQRLGDEQLVLTTMCQTVDQGHVVCKFFLDNPSKTVQDKMMEICNIFEPKKHPNVLTLMPQRIVTKDFEILIAYRQYVLYSLLEKMRNKIPKMTYEEKLWLIFQLLCAVAQVHGEKMIHGDIKPENIMVTSYNQLLLTDIKPYKPAYLAVDDLTSRRRYFGELDNQTRSYLAPERFLDSDVGKNLRSNQLRHQSMDIFSTGCVISEILMDGQILFDPARLQAFRKGEFSPSTVLERHSERADLINLAMKMMALDPEDRPDIQTCLEMFKVGPSPISFHKCFFQLGSSFVRPLYLYSDMKVSLIRKYFLSIWRTCFGNRAAPTLYEPVERIIFEKLREDFIESYNEIMKPGSDMFEFMDIEAAAAAEDEMPMDQAWPESVQIVTNWLGTFIQTCHFPQTKRVALEMFLVFARESSLQMRLQSMLPYVLKQLDDKQPKVQAKALETIVLMFDNVLDQHKDEQLASIDYKVFDNYILPAIQRLQKSSKDSQIVQVTFTKHLPLIAKIGNYFSELSLSSKISQKQAQKKEQAEDQQIDSNPRLKRDTDIEKEAPPANSANTYLNAFVNHDKDIENLRKVFIGMINDCAAKKDETSAEHLLYSKLGQLCEFFSSKDLMDNIIPLLGTCANNKLHLVKQDCLKSVLQVGFKVGKQALQESQMLMVYRDFLYDSEEIVVVKFLRTLVNMLDANLLPKQALLEDFFSPDSGPKQSLLQKLLPFLLHPNTWIRQQTVRFMVRLSNMNKQNILSQAEVFCIVRKNLKPYLRDPTNVVHFIVREKSIGSEADHIIRLMEMLRPPMSRSTFEGYVKAGELAFENQEEFKQKHTDRTALDLLAGLIAATQGQYQNYVKYQNIEMQAGQDLAIEPQREWKKFKQYDTYRVIKFETLSEMILKDESQFESQVQFPKLQREQFQNLNHFHQTYYSAMRPQLGENNHGINMDDMQTLSEIDWCMQALEILPDECISPIVKYKDGLPTKIANHAIPKNWRFQIEQQTNLCPQPTQIPQLSANFSKTTSLHVNQSAKQQGRLVGTGVTLGKRKNQLVNFRPEGRLVATLHEHSQPVVSMAVTDNQEMFLTGSKDGAVNIWSTKNISLDSSSHSKYSVNTGRKLNSVCTLQGTDSFCVAGGDSKLEIFSMNRRPSLSIQEVETNEVYMPNDCVIQTLQHENEGETMKCLSTILPVSHQSLVAYCTQRGSIYLHDLRSKQSALKHQNAVQMQRGMLTEMIIGQDPYQLLCGTMGGYVLVYDVRYNTISSAYKHNRSYPINSLSVYKPLEAYDYDTQNADLPNLRKVYNRSSHTSPLVMIAAGGESYEMSMLNLETGNIEYQMTSCEPQAPSDESNLSASVQLSEFHRESFVRDSFSYPEKFENNESLYKRYLSQTRSAVSSQQLLLTQSLDDEAFKASKQRYKFLSKAYESSNACRKILVPRMWSHMTQGTLTCDFAITGGNDMRLRYWSLEDLVNKSYFINTPNNDECQHQMSTAASGINLVREQICRAKNFPKVNGNMFQHVNKNLPSKLKVENTQIEMLKDSIYYKVINDMISQNYSTQANDSNCIASLSAARNQLGLCNNIDQSAGSANKFQFAEYDDKIVVLGYNGLSEWQHFNNLHMNEGNNTLMNQSLNDKWNKSQKTSAKQPGIRQSDSVKSSGNRGPMSFTDQQREDFLMENRDYLYRDSTNVSHTDAILDMDFVEIQTQNGDQAATTPLLVTCGRDCKVKIWR